MRHLTDTYFLHRYTFNLMQRALYSAMTQGEIFYPQMFDQEIYTLLEFSGLTKDIFRELRLKTWEFDTKMVRSNTG